MDLVVDGQEVFAATGGVGFDAAQPAIVFLHGAGFDRTVWRLLTRWFAHHGRSVLAVDMPGHGRSAGAPLADIPAMADWTAKLIAASGATSVAIVGHSMGALVALETAARHPARVRALGLLGVAAEMPVHPEMLESAAGNTPKVRELMTFWGLGRALQVGAMVSPGLWLTREALAVLARAKPGVIHTDLAACDSYKGALDAARKVACPSVLVLGDGDQMTPVAKAKPLMSALADSRSVVLPQCGHFMMVERPDQTLAALRDAV